MAEGRRRGERRGMDGGTLSRQRKLFCDWTGYGIP